uniref:Uncharacterized protein n=1 Tax=Brassica campestris TaxID=3711 RepID=M4DSK3_BRACM
MAAKGVECDTSLSLKELVDWEDDGGFWRRVDDIYPYISWTWNYDVVENADFRRKDEVEDDRIKVLKRMIMTKNDFNDHTWDFKDTPEFSLGLMTKKERMMKPQHAPFNEDMKAFAAQLFQQNFFVMQERLHKQMGENFEKIQYELKDLLKDASIEAEHGEISTSKPSPSKLLPRRFKRLDVNLSQADDINEWICTQGLEGLSQSSYVPGFDPSQTNKDNEPNDWWTPMTTVQNYQKLNQCKKLQLQHRQSGRNGLNNQARNLSLVIHQWRKMGIHTQTLGMAPAWYRPQFRGWQNYPGLPTEDCFRYMEGCT